MKRKTLSIYVVLLILGISLSLFYAYILRDSPYKVGLGASSTLFEIFAWVSPTILPIVFFSWFALSVMIQISLSPIKVGQKTLRLIIVLILLSAVIWIIYVPTRVAIWLVVAMLINAPFEVLNETKYWIETLGPFLISVPVIATLAAILFRLRYLVLPQSNHET